MKPTKAQLKMLTQIAEYGEKAYGITPGHTTTVSCEKNGWIVWQNNEHGVPRARLTESGKGLVK